jgi:hypothetical protein
MVSMIGARAVLRPMEAKLSRDRAKLDRADDLVGRDQAAIDRESAATGRREPLSPEAAREQADDDTR